jgi:cytochrome P450
MAVMRQRGRVRFRALRRDPLAVFARLAAQGDVVHARLGPQRIALVSHPDLVKEVLVTQGRSFMKGRALQQAKRILGNGLLTSEGDLHLRQRRLIQPLFREERIAGFGTDMVAEALRASARWRDGDELDIGAEMTRLTLAIVGQTLLDADVESDADEVGEAMTTATELFGRLLLPGAGLLERLPLPASRRFRSSQARLDAIVQLMIDERQERPGRHGDLLAMLLAARDDGGAMDSRQLRDEVMTIFLAGHETTSQALSWTWYLLAGGPHVEARLHEELAQLGGRPPRVDDLPALCYTRAVVAESMRLYPPAWAIGRRALRDVMLGDSPVKRGTIVVMSPWVVQRDARWFPEPERFAPERWLAEDPSRPRYAYFPFGGGSRLCIGERFAWMEAVLVLATLARRWTFRLAPGFSVEAAPRFTLRLAHGLRMVARAR